MALVGQTTASAVPVAGDDAAADAVDQAAAVYPCRARALHRRGDRAQSAARARRAAGRCRQPTNPARAQGAETRHATTGSRSDSSPTSEAISENLDASLENVFPDDPGTQERLGPDLAAQWKSAGNGHPAASSEGFDLEDIAAAKLTLRDHVVEQIAFRFADPAARLIAQRTRRRPRRGRLFSRRHCGNRRPSWAPSSRGRIGPRSLPDLRPARPVRPRPGRMPGLQLAASRPVRSGDARR